MPVRITLSGSFSHTERFLATIQRGDFYRRLDNLAQAGVAALEANTPVDSGVTAASWGYRISASISGAKITWFNTHIHEGVPIAIILQYGHGTGTGGYVQGRDFINPAMKPVFDRIAEQVWAEVRSA